MTRKKPTMVQPFESKKLTSGWSFKQTDTDEWLSVARVPTNVHLDLLDHDKYGEGYTVWCSAFADRLPESRIRFWDSMSWIVNG